MGANRALIAGLQWSERYALALIVAVVLTACEAIPRLASPSKAECWTVNEPTLECRGAASCEELATLEGSLDVELGREEQFAYEGVVLMIHPGF
jgi:hypothetical protein